MGAVDAMLISDRGRASVRAGDSTWLAARSLLRPSLHCSADGGQPVLRSDVGSGCLSWFAFPLCVGRKFPAGASG